MNKSPLTSDSDLPSCKILVEGKTIKDFYQVVNIQVTKEVNTISTAQIVLVDGDTATEKFSISESNDFVPGQKIEIQLGYHSKDVPVFKGIIVAQQIKVRSSSYKLVSQLTIKCADEALKLTVNRKNAIYKDLKDSEAISSILADSSVSKKVEATSFKHKKLVQYDCTDWDFILSRADINGLVVLSNDGEIEIEKPQVAASPVLSVTYGKDVIDFQAELNAQYQLASVLCKSWNNTQQKTMTGSSVEPAVNKQGNIPGKKLATVLGGEVHTMHTTVPEEEPVLKTWANAKLQKSRLSRIRGTVSFPGNALPLPGKLIEMNGFGTRMNGAAYISKVEHTFEAGSWITLVGFGLSAQWFSEIKTISSPVATGLLPGIRGLHNGVVTRLDSDPDGEYRIQVQLPMIEEGGEGVWARLSHEYASSETGTFFLPEVGDEVVVGFLNEDPRYPVILGMLHSKKIKPPYPSDKENNTKAIVTKSKLKLVFDEKKKAVFIETPNGNKFTISDDEKSITLEDQNSNKVLLSSNGIQLDSSKDIKMSAKGSILLSSNGELSLNSKSDLKMEGMNVTSAAKVSFMAKGSASASLKASGQVEVKGAIVMIN